MTYRVVILPRAEADLIRNAQWWALRHSAEQAAHWFDTVQIQLQTLEDFPESNGLSSENGTFPYEIRNKLLGLGSRRRYRAVFTIRNETVYVLTIRHGSQGELRPDDVDDLPAEF